MNIERDDITNLKVKITSNICVSIRGIVRSAAERIQQLCSDPGENTENDIFKLKLHKHVGVRAARKCGFYP